MSTLIVGALGSMGTRYKAILEHLKEDYLVADKEDTKKDILAKAKKVDRLIVCTPTDTHFDLLKELIPTKKPILCEKPISKSIKDLGKIFDGVNKWDCHFSMTFQYSELVSPNKKQGKSYYDYFRTGNDGLVWDCLQIIALANGEVELNSKSPYWKCMINDTHLKLTEMDFAYLNFVRKWLAGRINQDLDYLLKIHQKTERFKYDRDIKFN